jgi:hypothetical protein
MPATGGDALTLLALAATGEGTAAAQEKEMHLLRMLLVNNTRDLLQSAAVAARPCYRVTAPLSLPDVSLRASNPAFSQGAKLT